MSVADAYIESSSDGASDYSGGNGVKEDVSAVDSDANGDCSVSEGSSGSAGGS